jgi:hypothetical protein
LVGPGKLPVIVCFGFLLAFVGVFVTTFDLCQREMLLLLRRRRRRRRPKVFEANALESLSLFLSFHSLAAAFTLLTLASFDSSSRSDTLCQSSDCAYTHSGNQDQATTPKTKQKWRLRQPRHLPAERLL